MEAITCPECGAVNEFGVLCCTVCQTTLGKALEHQQAGEGQRQLESTKDKPSLRTKILSAVLLGGFIGAVGSYIALFGVWYTLFRSGYSDQLINVLGIVGFAVWLLGLIYGGILLYKAARNHDPGM